MRCQLGRRRVCRQSDERRAGIAGTGLVRVRPWIEMISGTSAASPRPAKSFCRVGLLDWGWRASRQPLLTGKLPNDNPLVGRVYACMHALKLGQKNRSGANHEPGSILDLLRLLRREAHMARSPHSGAQREANWQAHTSGTHHLRGCREKEKEEEDVDVSESNAMMCMYPGAAKNNV